MEYSLSQWLSFFYIYCFIGWVWECLYVSINKKQWVNRGFLHGPILPIYGSGAVVILISTLQVRDNLILVFVFGMVAASILEFCTGYCMEKMFGVRYWDYSNKRLNLMGHICLEASIGWGIASVIMVHIVHRPIERAVLLVPSEVLEIIIFIISIGTTVDLTLSFVEALDLKAMLEKLSSSREQIRILAKRVEIVTTFYGEDYRRYRQQLAVRQMEKKKKSQKSRWETFENNLISKKEWTVLKLSKISERASEYFHRENEDKYGVDVSRQLADSKENELKSFTAKLEEEKQKLLSGTERQYKHLLRIISRNPSAVSYKHKQELEEIKELMNDDKDNM